MERTTWSRWTLRYDADATRAAFARISLAGAEGCACRACENFAAARHLAWPEGFRQRLAQLGVDIALESEVYHVCPLEPGSHLYGGWFHVVGWIEWGEDASVPIDDRTRTVRLEPDGPGLSIGLTARTALVPAEMAGRQVLQLEFQLVVPWVLGEPEAE